MPRIFGCSSRVHAVQIQTVQIWLHHRKRLCPVIDMPVTVMKVVNDADMVLSEFLQSLADRHQILRFTAPATVVVQSQA